MNKLVCKIFMCLVCSLSFFVTSNAQNISDVLNALQDRNDKVEELREKKFNEWKALYAEMLAVSDLPFPWEEGWENSRDDLKAIVLYNTGGEDRDSSNLAKNYLRKLNLILGVGGVHNARRVVTLSDGSFFEAHVGVDVSPDTPTHLKLIGQKKYSGATTSIFNCIRLCCSCIYILYAIF